MTAEDPAQWWVAGLLATALVGSCPDVATAALQEQALDSLRAQAVEAASRKASLSPAQRKVDSQVRHATSPEAAPLAASPRIPGGKAADLEYYTPWRENGRFHLEVQVTDTSQATLAGLRSAGLDIEIVNEAFDVVQGWIPEVAVALLAELPAVRVVRPVYPGVLNAGSVTSEGDHAARADLVRGLGYDGSGVVVGVISDGIDDLATSQATGDLPAVNVPPDPRCRRGSGQEGTAMLEIVHDLAPGATLLFSEGLSSPLQLVNSIVCLAAAGANVIVDDIASPTQPYFQDGAVALTAAQVVANGISYLTAAGNFAAGGYLVDNYRAGANGFHDFDPSAGADLFDTVVLPAGGTLTCHLQWNEPFGSASSDYDLFVIDSISGLIVAQSVNPQPFYPDPQEDLGLQNLSASPFLLGVGVQKVSGSDRTLKLLCQGMVPPGLEWTEKRFGIFGQAARPEVIAVGAINALGSLDVTEDFSSWGPVPIFFPIMAFRPKPDLAGFDGVRTTSSSPELNPFFGTSAAAPHAAAVAALLLTKNPVLTPAQLQVALTSTAVDIGPGGFDDASGFGRLDAFAAINAVSVPTTTTTSTTIPSARCVTGGCDDRNPCTDDTCDPATGCQHAANTASCSDGNECTLMDRCNGGQCQSGASVTAGTLSTLITAGVNASLADCRNDKRKQVKKVVNPLIQAAKAFSRAEVAGVGTKKWTKQVAKGEQMIGTARSKLTKVEAKLSSACVSQLGDAIRTGALGDACLR